MATFVVGSTTATFGATIRGAQQESGDMERLTVGVNLTDETAWRTLLSLATTKYHVHVPLGGASVIDVVNGAGEGTLTISGLGAVTAVMVNVRRNTYLRSARSLGSADFLITGVWT